MKFSVFSLLLAAGGLCAGEYSMDLNFDGHPDRMVEKRSSAWGKEYRILLFDPESQKYREDETFSRYIVGVLPQTDPEKHIIQTRIQIPRQNGSMPGYRFAVKDGRLCFLNGKPLPEQCPVFFHGDKITDEAVAFDREAAGEDYAGLETQWENVREELRKLHIPFNRAGAAAMSPSGGAAEARMHGRMKVLLEKLRETEMPVQIPCRIPDEKTKKLRKEYLDKTAPLLKLIAPLWKNPAVRRTPVDPQKALAHQIFSFGAFRTMACIESMRIQTLADAGKIREALETWEENLGDFPGEGPLIAGLVACAVESMRMDALADILSAAQKSDGLNGMQIANLDALLQKEEALYRREWLRAWDMECAFAMDTIDTVLEETVQETEDGKKAPVLLLAAVPCLRDKIQLAKHFAACRKIFGNESGLTEKCPETPEAVSFAGKLVQMDAAPVFRKYWLGIAKIRAGRAALDHFGLKRERAPVSDPLSGKAFHVRTESFDLPPPEKRRVSGIRFYSASARDGKYGNGETPEDGTVSFDLIDKPERKTP